MTVTTHRAQPGGATSARGLEPDQGCEVVRRWLAAVAARDDAALLALADPEIVLRPMPRRHRPPYRGPGGVRQWLADTAAVGAIPFTITRVEPLEGDRVIVEGAIRDAPTSMVAVFEVRAGRIASERTYLSDRQLLERVGAL